MISDVTRAWGILSRSEQSHAYRVLLVLLVGTGLELLSLGLFMPVVSVLASETFEDDYPWLADLIGTQNDLQMTIRVFGLLAFVFLIKSVYVAWSVWFQRGFAARIEYRLSQALFASYVHRPFVFHLNNNSSVLIRNVGMASQFVTLTIDSLLVLGTDGAVLVAVVGFLLFVEPIGTIAVVIALGLTALLFHSMTKTRIQSWGARRMTHEARRIQYLQEGLGAIKEIKVLGQEQEFLRRFEHEVGATTQIGRGYGTLTALPRIWLEFLTLVGLAILVIILVAQGKSLNETLPVLGVFAAGSFKIMPSMNRIIFAIQNLRYSHSILDTLASDLGSVDVDLGRPREQRRDLLRGIEFRDVHFSYPEGDGEAITDLTFRVEPGTAIGFVGSSGAGKSTLVDLLLGLLKPTSGQILIDDVDSTSGLSNATTAFGYVPQTIYLTDDTLRNNVAFGVPPDQIDEQRVLEALRQASLLEFAAHLPEGLDTGLGEQGVRLSGGQRQRIGIARALYPDPSVLIFDEATSALDVLTEEQIVREIAAMRGNRTLIVIAHRFSSVSFCDTVHQVERGAIVMTGKPQDVARRIESLQTRERS
jgi:ABC-type multidrug transport system fused ATPase/permease subunit